MVPQVFKRFVEVGRVALVADGVDKGKLCVIVDVINQRSVSFTNRTKLSQYIVGSRYNRLGGMGHGVL